MVAGVENIPVPVNQLILAYSIQWSTIAETLDLINTLTNHAIDNHTARRKQA